MKSNVMRIIAAMMALVMIVTCFASCKKEDGGEDITKPSDVEAPVNSGSTDLNDYNTDETTETTTVSSSSTGSSSSSSSSSSNSSGSSSSSSSSSGSSSSSTGNTGTAGGSISSADVMAALNAAGYEYDAEQDIYYSTLNPWQRHFGFGDEYDQLAPYANMRYTTLKIDFNYGDLLWRLQWWKGQYGVLEGAELGVYTKDPNDNSTTFYDCAADENLLEMSFEYYRTASDFKKNNMLFYREEQEHWWLTGFKFGYTAGSNKSVVKATLKAFDDAMADGIESGLQKVTDSKGNWNGFVMYQDGIETMNYYIREGNNFTVVWMNAGYENYTN